MTDFEDDVPMQFYAHVQAVKDSVRTLLSNVDEILDIDEIDEEDMTAILKFIHAIDTTLAEYPDPEDRCARLRNLVIAQFAVGIKGGFNA